MKAIRLREFEQSYVQWILDVMQAEALETKANLKLW